MKGHNMHTILYGLGVFVLALAAWINVGFVAALLIVGCSLILAALAIWLEI